jgi:hypothetical protein
MGRTKEKPDLDNAGVNPFSESLQILMSNNTTHVKNKFGEDDKIVANYESVRYTKVFDQTGVKALVASLSIRAKELYLHIMYSLESGEDILWIHRGRYMGMYGIRSVNTYKDSVKDLAEKGFIYPHVSLKDVYWINPHYFFKGDRRMKYPNRVKIVKRMNF